MKVEWDGKVGPAFVAGITQLAALLVGGAVLWTQLQDKVDNTQAAIKSVHVDVTGLRNDLKTTQKERAEQSERLGKVETAVNFLTSYFRGSTQFDHGTFPFSPATQPPNRDN